MRGVIEQAKHSKSGKSLGVLIQGTWYTTKHFVLENKVGQEIVFDPKEITMGDGAKIQTIQAYTLPGDMVAKDPTPTATPSRSSSTPTNNPYQPLVSNLAAHLIAAGKEPSELAEWYQVCVWMLEQKDPLNDEIPF